MPVDTSHRSATARAADDELAVLLVEDNPGDARLFKHHINTDRSRVFPTATVTHVESIGPALEALGSGSFDIVLLDLGLAESSGVETLERFSAAIDGHDGIEPVPVVVLTGLADERASIEAIERGAQDYLVKDDVNRKILNRTVRYAIERHSHEQRLRRQNERLEEFAHVVSHDLRNPLNVAQGQLELLESDDTGTIRRNLDRMEAIIDDVLTLARNGQQVEAVEPVDLSALARRSWIQVPTAGATLTVEDGLETEADPHRCQQLFENLFRNAIEHGGDGVEIRVEATDTGFRVSDDGPGIPRPERDRVFEPGYTTNPDGTGFGLNIVSAIAEAHGWRVEVGSAPGGGASFEFQCGY